jgi:5-methylcytosine-specific restriction endonuclease McrA
MHIQFSKKVLNHCTLMGRYSTSFTLLINMGRFNPHSHHSSKGQVQYIIHITHHPTPLIIMGRYNHSFTLLINMDRSNPSFTPGTVYHSHHSSSQQQSYQQHKKLCLLFCIKENNMPTARNILTLKITHFLNSTLFLVTVFLMAVLNNTNENSRVSCSHLGLLNQNIKQANHYIALKKGTESGITLALSANFCYGCNSSRPHHSPKRFPSGHAGQPLEPSALLCLDLTELANYL